MLVFGQVLFGVEQDLRHFAGVLGEACLEGGQQVGLGIQSQVVGCFNEINLRLFDQG